MLNISYNFVRSLLEILLMIVSASILLIIDSYVGLDIGSILHGTLISDLTIALLLSSSFLGLSGFFLSVVVVGLLGITGSSWLRRAVADSILFVIHFFVFISVFGSGDTSSSAVLIAIGIAAIFISEAGVETLERVSSAARRHQSTRP